MAAKATRTYILVLLLVLGVVATTATVGVSTVFASAGAGGAANGDPDRPNDSSKPSVQQSVPGSTILPCSSGSAGGPGEAAGVERAEKGWTWAKWYVATLLGRFGR
jgi:hypothetical protein